MRPATDLPPVILLGIDTPIGLAVLRELGRHHVPVHGIAAGARSIGLRSRYLFRGHLRRHGPGALAAQLREIAQAGGARFVMTVSMHDAIAVREAADRGELGGVRPLLADRAVLDLVNDKLEICRHAAALGIATPAIWQPDQADPDRIPDSLTYPAVVKWRDPELAYAPLEAAGVGFRKFEYVPDRGSLVTLLARYRPVGQFPMVQSYCPGYGLGQMMLCHDGQVPLRFQHRRVAEWPPEGGSSSCCESIDLGQHQELMGRSEALLRRIGWEGPAMVEYRYDPTSRIARLMEINGRFWGSQPLASCAGVAFGWGTYQALGLGRTPAQPAYRSGVRCRYMVPHTRRLLTILFHQDRIQDRSVRFDRYRELLTYIAEFFHPRGHYYVFSWRDPMPFRADVGAMAGKAWRGAWAALTARVVGRRRKGGSRG